MVGSVEGQRGGDAYGVEENDSGRGRVAESRSTRPQCGSANERRQPRKRSASSSKSFSNSISFCVIVTLEGVHTYDSKRSSHVPSPPKKGGTGCPAYACRLCFCMVIMKKGLVSGRREEAKRTEE